MITFTRASTGTWLNPATGLLEVAAINAPRLEAGGLLFEAARTNLVLQSNVFSNAAWTKTGSSVATGAVLAPDGTPAFRITESAANTTHLVTQAGKVVTGSTKYCRSVFAKADSAGRYLYLDSASIANWSNASNVTFDLINGVVSLVNGAPDNYGMVAYPNGWYFCWLTTTTIASPATVPISVFITAGAGTGYLGDGVSGIYIFGAGLEAGDGPSSYIPTVASTVTRAVDLAFVASGAWLRDGQGTLLIEATHAGVATDVASGSMGTAANSPSILLWLQGSSARASGRVYNAAGTVMFSQIIGPAVAAGAVLREAIGFDTGNAQFSTAGVVSANGALPVSNPTIDRISIGTRGASSLHMTGRIRRIQYSPYRLTAAQLQALTA